ncbi:MAG: hypothetical protein IH591_11585 [Bacteroidales bacterium]|nr:hypothetical protein [Bacteroidales bacterium]
MLKDLAEGKISAEEAHETVRKAFAMRKTLMQNFRKVTVNRRNLFFRQLLIELGKIQKSTLESQPPGDDLDMLIARCNIFEALLIRHFRSADDFGKMVMK